jgi:hypothetical protein
MTGFNYPAIMITKSVTQTIFCAKLSASQISIGSTCSNPGIPRKYRVYQQHDAADIGADVGGGQQLNFDAQPIEPARPVVGGTACFHDDQADIPILEPALELGARQAVRFDHLPRGISDRDLGNSSSIHFGLLYPHEHRLHQFGAKKTGESIPSFNRTCAKKAAQAGEFTR